jgi:hypothetical protein
MTFDGVYDYEMPAEEHYHQNKGASVASTLRGTGDRESKEALHRRDSLIEVKSKRKQP